MSANVSIRKNMTILIKDCIDKETDYIDLKQYRVYAHGIFLFTEY